MSQNQWCVRCKPNLAAGALFLLIAVLTLLLTACGGGASSQNSDPPLHTTIAATSNPLVAQYTVSLSAGETVAVEFGPTISYGQMTSPQASPVGGGDTTVIVAGMKQNTLYHMRAVVTSSGRMPQMDSDHTFQTGPIPPARVPSISVTTSNSARTQPGVELLSLTQLNSKLQCLATDHQGNVIWYYDYDPALGIPQPVKLLPNGHLLMILFGASGSNGGMLREIDLAGTTIRQLAFLDLKQKFLAAGYSSQPYSIDHDVVLLPNGHIVLIMSDFRYFTDLPGYPGQTRVLGDAIVDLDENFNLVWAWDAFDHLDINRHPIYFPDWTHANALAYSADDGNLLLSLRHQNWVIKIDYQNGNGSGDILWRLGDGGDFVLDSDASDWFYAQHDANFASSNTTGDFQLALFDNGDFRQGNTSDFNIDASACAPGDAPLCYSASKIYEVNEATLTASRKFSYNLPYSFWGGVNRLLPNSDVYVDETMPNDLPNGGARVVELTQDAQPANVWQMIILYQSSYRTIHLPSLYPGVQW